MNVDFDFENLKLYLIDFLNKWKIHVAVFLFALFSGLAVSLFAIRKNYYDRINSSNQLIEYMQGENDDFLKSNHKGFYSTIKNIVINKQNPSFDKYNEFSLLDEYVFKNLFYFAKKLYFGKDDEFVSYYENDKNPWSKLMLSCNVFWSKSDGFSIKNKEEYLVNYLIGSGKKC